MRQKSIVQAIFYLLVLWSLCHCSLGLKRDYEIELINYLKTNITNFSPLLYPKLNRGSIVYISMNCMLSRIVSVDSAKQSVKITVLMMANWDEERLVWNSSNFGNVTIVNWDSSQIWFPVIMVYNGIGDNQVLVPQVPVYLTSHSPNRTTVTATWRREFEFSCLFDMSKFPTDEHACDLEFFFSDQGRGNTMVRPRKDRVTFDELATYQESSEWIMLGATTNATERSYTLVKGLEPMSLPTFILQITIKRVSNYYTMNIIIPLLLLTLLQVVVYFFVPVKCGEKLGFGITIMLSYTVFLLLMDNILPKSQSMPGIASFITATMSLSTISMLLTSLIMRFHYTPKGTRMPAWVRALLVRCLGRLFRVRGADQERTSDSDTSEQRVESDSRDWVIAADAMERLMVVLGVVAIAVIMGLFIVKPYS